MPSNMHDWRHQCEAAHAHVHVHAHAHAHAHDITPLNAQVGVAVGYIGSLYRTVYVT